MIATGKHPRRIEGADQRCTGCVGGNREECPLCHVLIIEDEPLVAMTIQDILESEGATSSEIVDTVEAAVSAATANKPSVITSDVKLLEGTGPRAVAEIYKRFGLIPVIFISETPEECKPCNPPGLIIPKPFTAQLVVDAFYKVAPIG